tara:strand:+ start:25433 stop:26158 length:726 start_codon:yes stop_codon:yes gene_type:complete
MTWEDDAIVHALEEAPRESCGLVVVISGRLQYFPCENMSDDEEEFTLNPEHWARCEDEGEIRYVVHSHPTTGPELSIADKVCCEKGDLEWRVVNPFKKSWASYKPCGYSAPLIGRQWVWNVTDCWTLVRDWFGEQGIKLRDWERTTTPEEFERRPYFDDCWKETGFYELEEDEQLQKGDCLLMGLTGVKPDHMAVYLGNGDILHHLRARLSSRDVYSGYLQKRTIRRIRHYDIDKSASRKC